MPEHEKIMQVESNAQIDATSDQNPGGTVAFNLPVDLSQPRLVNPDAVPLILLAEDNEFTAETMRDYLLFHNFRVNLARNGYEVIEQALFATPDLIIMDIQMPGINGFEAMQRLRAEAATATTPIIALTAL